MLAKDRRARDTATPTVNGTIDAREAIIQMFARLHERVKNTARTEAVRQVVAHWRRDCDEQPPGDERCRSTRRTFSPG